MVSWKSLGSTLLLICLLAGINYLLDLVEKKRRSD